eukprot:206072_1
MSNFCEHCDSALTNNEAPLCSECGKPQQNEHTEASEAIQITVIRTQEQNKQPSNDSEPEQNEATNANLEGMRAEHFAMKQLNEINQKLKEAPNSIELQEVMKQYDEAVTACNSKKMPETEEFHQNSNANESNDIECEENDAFKKQYFEAMGKGFEEWKKNKLEELNQRADEILRERNNTANDLDQQKLADAKEEAHLTENIGAGILCIVIIFLGFAIWASATEQPSGTITGLWVTFGVVAAAYCVALGFNISADNKVERISKSNEKSQELNQKADDDLDDKTLAVILGLSCVIYAFLGLGIWASATKQPKATEIALWSVFAVFTCAFEVYLYRVFKEYDDTHA